MINRQLSLREKKYATQKLKILDTFDEKLKEKSLSNISVKEIAEELEISEMTFFNYFKNKGEVLVYFIELWNLQMQLKIENLSSMDAIYLIFEETAKMIEKNPNLFMEIVASMTLNGLAKKNIIISKAERILRFGYDIEYKVGGFKELVMPLIQDIDIPKNRQFSTYVALHNTCFCTPILARTEEFSYLKEYYFEQLEAILNRWRDS